MHSSSRVACGTAASCLILLYSATAVAQTPRPASAGAVEDAYVEHVTYTYAQVLRVVPVFSEIQVTELREDCTALNASSANAAAEREPPVTTVPGGRMGAVGALLQTGFAAAAPAPRQALPEEHTAEPEGCPLVDDVVTVTRQEGFDVEYRYRGEVFVSRLDHDPGDRLRIRVAVVPAAETATGAGSWQVASPSR
jgi:uncharacterized protein YcfJ